MLAWFFARICRHPCLKKKAWKWLYQFLVWYDRTTEWTFMNYGYVPLGDQEETPALDLSDEINRTSIQLYHHVTKTVNLRGCSVLEVGSGRGGGVAYIRRYLRPRAIVGVDYTVRAIAFSHGCHRGAGLSFLCGDAEALPFANAVFDVVVNVESSHCYQSVEAFLAEVKRILRPGGYLLYADFRSTGDLEKLYSALEQSGLALRQQHDITPHVIAALRLDSPRKLSMIRRSTPKCAWKSLQEFAGVEHSRIYRGFCSGEVQYLSLVLQKGE